MTPNWEKIKQIIRDDAKARFLYKADTGETCVLGGLAEGYGVPLPQGQGSYVSSNTKPIGSSLLQHFASALSHATGLALEHLKTLQDINDADEDGQRRRYSLLLQIKIWERNWDEIVGVL